MTSTTIHNELNSIELSVFDVEQIEALNYFKLRTKIKKQRKSRPMAYLSNQDEAYGRSKSRHKPKRKKHNFKDNS